MSGSFLLELDTTGPDIEVTAPSFTTNSAKTDIWVYGSERLDTFQDFYFIDANGNRHEAIFDHLGDRFHGVVYFSEFPIGIVTFYAQVRDDVLNLSRVETVSINITEQQFFSISVEDKGRQVDTTVNNRKIEVSNKAMDALIMEHSGAIATKDYARKVEVEVRNGK